VYSLIGAVRFPDDGESRHVVEKALQPPAHQLLMIGE
jgi:hypothetical protein